MASRGWSYWRLVWPSLQQERRLRGVWPIAQDMMQMRKAQWGWLKGVDANGNRYYENPSHPIMFRRWVLYPRSPFSSAADPANVTPEWDMWLHQQFEETPDEMNLPRYPWQLPPRKGSYLSQMGWAPEYIPQGYYTRKVLGGHSAVHEASGQTLEGPQQLKTQKPPPQLSSESHLTKRGVVHTAESASSGPSTPATCTPSSASAVTTEPHTEDDIDVDREGNDGSEIVGHGAKLYEPWSKIKRDPKLEPRQELY